MQNVLLKSSIIAGLEGVQFMQNFHRWQIFVRHVVVNMRWVNALDQDSAISCIWSRFRVSWDDTCTREDVEISEEEDLIQEHRRRKDALDHLEEEAVVVGVKVEIQKEEVAAEQEIIVTEIETEIVVVVIENKHIILTKNFIDFTPKIAYKIFKLIIKASPTITYICWK